MADLSDNPPQEQNAPHASFKEERELIEARIKTRIQEQIISQRKWLFCLIILFISVLMAAFLIFLAIILYLLLRNPEKLDWHIIPLGFITIAPPTFIIWSFTRAVYLNPKKEDGLDKDEITKITPLLSAVKNLLSP